MMCNPQTWNLYAYAGDNPTTNNDPSGEKYRVCQTDENGDSTNCASISDEQFGKLESENKGTLTFEGNGNILQNGTLIGTYKQTSVDLSLEALQVVKGINRANPQGFINAFAATAPVVGTVGGLLAPVIGMSGLTTLSISSATAGPLVTDPDAQRLVNWLFQEADRLPGGTAGAVRYELMNNDTVGGVSHIQKAEDAIAWAQRLLKSGNLSFNDQLKVRAMIQELVNALATKRVQ